MWIFSRLCCVLREPLRLRISSFIWFLRTLRFLSVAFRALLNHVRALSGSRVEPPSVRGGGVAREYKWWGTAISFKNSFKIHSKFYFNFTQNIVFI